MVVIVEGLSEITLISRVYIGRTSVRTFSQQGTPDEMH